jgi:exonuclease III
VTGDQLPDSHPGVCAVADVVDAKGRLRFTAVSLYGQWESIADGRIYSCARLHRMISDLTGVFVTARQRPVILAGDLNVTTQIAYSKQTQAETDGAAAVFARLQAWGLSDCLAITRESRARLPNCTCPDGDACCHVQTFRLHNRATSRPTQLDYAFASDKLVSRLVSCDVVQDAAAWELSDHCPLVLEFAERPLSEYPRAKPVGE